MTTYLAGILRRDWWDRLLSLPGDVVGLEEVGLGLRCHPIG